MSDIVKRIGKEICTMFEKNYEVVNSGEEPRLDLCERAVETCVNAKQSLIDMLSKHPNWDAENLRVHFNSDYTRPIDTNLAENNLYNLMAILWKSFRTAVDAYGCARLPFLQLSKTVMLTDEKDETLNGETIRAIVDYDNDEAESAPNESTNWTMDRNRPLYCLSRCICEYDQWTRMFARDLTVSKKTERLIKKVMPSARIHAGQKTTRALYKLLTQYNWEEQLRGKNESVTINTFNGQIIKQNDLDRARGYYTQYADAMNELTVTRHTVLSVNPIDFLRMSIGNSWNSCHEINFDNEEGSNFHSGGCWSYAYDEQSMIYYTVEAGVKDENITYAGKYTRQIVLWNGTAVCLSRLYPQKWDGENSAYQETRTIVEQIIADCTGYGNMWKKLPLTSESYNNRLRENTVKHTGHQYPDYYHGAYPIYAPSFLVANKDDEELKEFCNFSVGSDKPICIVCGDRIDMHDYPICSYCAGSNRNTCSCCGERRRREDMFYIEHEDRYVCQDCLDEYYFYDEYAGDYYSLDDSIYVENYGNISEYTYNNSSDFFYCEECNNYYYRDYMDEEELDGTFMCHDCYEEFAQECERCGEIHDSRNMRIVAESGELICEECVEEDEFICTNCGKVHKMSELAEEIDERRYSARQYCKTCYDTARHVCEVCGEVYYLPDSSKHYRLRDDNHIEERVCQMCIRQVYKLNFDTNLYEYIADAVLPDGFIVIVKNDWSEPEYIDVPYAKYLLSAIECGHSPIYALYKPFTKESLREAHTSKRDICFGRFNGKVYERINAIGWDNEKRVRFFKPEVTEYIRAFVDANTKPEQEEVA